MVGIAVISNPYSHLLRPAPSSSSSSSSRYPSISRRPIVSPLSICCKTLAPNPTPFLLLPRSSSGPGEPQYGDLDPDIGFEIEVEKSGDKKNRRRIQCRIGIDADLEAVWSVLTDYEGLADFIPGLAVSQLIEKKDNFARIYQVGQQNLVFGLKFDAKGVIDCYERDLEFVTAGRRRDIEFKMIEGDFQMFEGSWSIQQIDNEFRNDGGFISDQEFRTTLSYVVDLEPKPWLPVRLLEGRLCREFKSNLLCVRQEAQRVQRGEWD